MKDIYGNLWDWCGKIPKTTIAITTNGFVKNNGECVMGRGCAKEAILKYPGIASVLGNLIVQNGNHVFKLNEWIYSFPVKHNWWEEADVNLITRSCREIVEKADLNKEETIVIPRPGCGNGRLNYHRDVLPILRAELDDRFKIITWER